VRARFDRINTFLDQYVLPWPVRFLTFRFVILATIALLIPLIVFASNTSLVLLINSYLNTMSVAVSSIVLLYATISERQQRHIAEMQEQRATDDHTHIIETYELTTRALANQHEEIQDLKELIADMQGKSYIRRTLPTSPDVRDLHPQGRARFESDHTRRRLGRYAPPNPLSGEHTPVDSESHGQP
jgi:sensor histidine kinase YesM